MDSPALRLRAVVALLGRFPALAGVDLAVARRRVVVLAGPNGAGKSTVLRVCAGLLRPTSGSAEVLGLDVGADPRGVRRRVGLLGHATFLYDDLTVAENVRFWSRAGRSEPSDAAAAMALLGVDGRLAAVPVARLSAGQRRRTALAVLVARRPELWLLDEPHAGLDAAGRDVLDDVVRRAVDAGATVVMASHDLDRAVAMADEVVHLGGGRVLRSEPGGRNRATPPVVEVAAGAPVPPGASREAAGVA